MTVGGTQNSVAEVVREHAASLLRLARVHSLCDDDAADAYQRTLEIYLERIEHVERATTGQWLRTVCKHEAMRLRAARLRVAPSDPRGWDLQPAADPHDGAERAASLERVARAAEALQACSPASARAMLLRADGASYEEIAASCGWTRSQVNRHLSQGRRRFMQRFSHIESGAACAGHLPRLMAIVDGEASPDDYLRLRPHLRHCAACRGVLKALYTSEPALAGLLPVSGVPVAALIGTRPPAGPAVDGVAEAPGWLARAYESLGFQVADRVARGHALLEAAGAGKAAAVVASTAAVAMGGVAAVDGATTERRSPPRAALARAVAPPNSEVAPPRGTPPATPTAVIGVATAAAGQVAVEPTARAAPSASPSPWPSPAATATPSPAPVGFAFEPPGRPEPARPAPAESGAMPGSFEPSAAAEGAASSGGGGGPTFER